MTEHESLFHHVHLTAREREWLAAMPAWSGVSGVQIARKFDRLSAFQSHDHQEGYYGDGALDIVDGDPRDWDDPTPA